MDETTSETVPTAGPAPLPLDAADYLRAIEDAVEAVESTIADGAWDRRVPMSDTWVLSDLIRHLSGAQRRAAAIVASGQEQTSAPPPDGADLAAWFADGARELLDTLRSADPAAPCWTYGADQTAAFWFRRQAHETTVHRFDAEETVGRPRPVDAPLAADGVDEVLTLMMPRAAERLGQPPRLRAPVELRATDTGHRWLLGASAEGTPPPVLPDGAAEPAATIEGTASDLLLCVWGRKNPTDVLAVHGDPDVAAGLWSGRLTT